MPEPGIVGTDPLPLLLRYLDGEPAVQAALGGAGRVGGVNAPPYPRVSLTDPPGFDPRAGRWLVSVPVDMEVLGDPGGTTSKAALRDALAVVYGRLALLPEHPRQDGEPVVTAVTFGAAGGWSPLPTGQPRYVGRVTVYAHP